MSKAIESQPVGVSLRRRAIIAAGAVIAMPLAACGGGSMMDDGSMDVDLRDDTSTSPNGRRSLPLLRLDDGVLDIAGRREFALRAQRGSAQLLDGVDSATFGYNGPLLGPALRVRKGEVTRIAVQNDLGETTSVHWHGLVVPAEVDGGPHQPIAPGARWIAEFMVVNAASTCWFHPHAHGSTGRQVVAGLAGMLVVEDPALEGLALPSLWGVDDLALVLQDKRFTANGRIDYALTANDRVSGYAGDRLLVNGISGPVWDAPAQWVRLRLLNGCNARALSLRIGDALPMLQVANEGGFLAAPVVRMSITLWPGERAEVLVDFSRVAGGQDVRIYAAGANGAMGGMGMGMGMGNPAGSAEVTAMVIRVSRARQAGAIAAPPERLPVESIPTPGAAATVRTFNLDGGMMSSIFTINDRSFEMARVDFTVPARALEVWRFVNRTMMAHPMHVHGVQMSILSRDGAAPPAHERGLRDTFVVEPMQTVTMAVLTPAAASAVPLVLHCHNLEHEDAGMMAQFVVG